MADVFPATPEGDVAVEVAELLGSVSRRIRMAANRDLGPLGITWSQLRALRTVDRCDGAIRMSELAARLGIARRSATASSNAATTPATGGRCRSRSPRPAPASCASCGTGGARRPGW